MTNGPQLPLARELASLLERALNREIAASTAATDLLAELDGESFAIDVRGLGVRCVLRAANGRVDVEQWWQPATTAVSAALPPSAAASPPPAATATLSASPFDLLRLAR